MHSFVVVVVVVVVVACFNLTRRLHLLISFLRNSGFKMSFTSQSYKKNFVQEKQQIIF